MVDNYSWRIAIEVFGTNGVPNYECHQRYMVYCDCRKYDLTPVESWECADTCNHLPVITEADKINQKENIQHDDIEKPLHGTIVIKEFYAKDQHNNPNLL